MSALLTKVKAMFGLQADDEAEAKLNEIVEAAAPAEPTTETETASAEDVVPDVPEDTEDTDDDEPEPPAEPQELIEAHAKIENLNQALNGKQSDNDKLRQENSELRAKLERLTAGMSFDDDNPPADWNSALARCDGDYVEARRKHPDLFAAFMDKNQK